ncbi:TBC1 domain family member 8, partial [Brachionus plicatilis]
LFKQVSKIGIIDGDSRNLTINKEQFLKLNKNLCDWTALCDAEIAGRIFDFLKCCPSERSNETKISKLIMTSIANGVPSSNELKKTLSLEENETIDFLHFIRFMNIVYNSDANMRLKFLYGVSMNDSQKKIDIYNGIFSVLLSKLEFLAKNSEKIRSESNLVESGEKNHKSSLPIMNQEEFISFWKIVYNLFTGMENEGEMYHAAATVSTLLLKLGEASRKFQNESSKIKSGVALVAESDKLPKSASLTNLDISSNKVWSITFEQLIASVLTDNHLVNYFDTKYDVEKKLAEYKAQHA